MDSSLKVDLHRQRDIRLADASGITLELSLEPHYSVQVLAELWRLDESTIRHIFESAPGVLRLGRDDSAKRSGKRAYFTLRIPASVAEREYRRRIVASTKNDYRHD